jgi:hypothetical protein
MNFRYQILRSWRGLSKRAMDVMKGTKLASLGLLMPPSFPTGVHDKVHSCLVKYKNTHPAQWRSFGLGWMGVAYRYRAMAEYDEQFTTSIKNFGNSPPSEERYKQDNTLLGFFVCAVSTIECFFYSTYWMGVILKPDEFPSDSKNLKYLYADNIVSKFSANFHGDALTQQMEQCVANSTYIDMKNIRDVLSHRGMLPRTFYRGGDRDGMATMPTNPKDTSDQWQFDLQVDVRTTASCRQWLDNMLKQLIAAANNFCDRRL